MTYYKNQDIPSPTINQFTCDPIFRSMQIKLSDADEDSTLGQSNNSLDNLVGQCWNCETKDPLGLYCSQCVDTDFIYETIPNASSSSYDGSHTNSLSTCITNRDKGVQVNGQLSFKKIMMQLCNLIKAYFVTQSTEWGHF